MVFGHIHGNTDSEYWPLIAQSERMLNAGVDVNGFRPVTFAEMVQNNIFHKQRSESRRAFAPFYIDWMEKIRGV